MDVLTDTLPDISVSVFHFDEQISDFVSRKGSLNIKHKYGEAKNEADSIEKIYIYEDSNGKKWLRSTTTSIGNNSDVLVEVSLDGKDAHVKEKNSHTADDPTNHEYVVKNNGESVNFDGKLLDGAKKEKAVLAVRTDVSDMMQRIIAERRLNQIN